MVVTNENIVVVTILVVFVVFIGVGTAIRIPLLGRLVTVLLLLKVINSGESSSMKLVPLFPSGFWPDVIIRIVMKKFEGT